MITPSFSLTVIERVLPKLALDFTIATLDPRITFTRSGNTATYTNSSGVITAINANLPRFDYNPVTLVCQGLLIEEVRTNIILNSLIDGTILNTQIVTTSATAYTLSFYGTGSIVLTGTHSATVVGTGVYPSRKTYTFTPTAGALTLTVSGAVQYAQLEAGSFATSFIPTAAISSTRNADVATMTGTNFSDWFNASEGTFAAWASIPAEANSRTIICAGDGTASERMLLNVQSSRSGGEFRVVDGGVEQCDILPTYAYTAGQTIKLTGAYKVNSFAASMNGVATGTDSSGTIPTPTTLYFGLNGVSLYSNLYIQKVLYWPQRLINNEVQAFSK